MENKVDCFDNITININGSEHGSTSDHLPIGEAAEGQDGLLHPQRTPSIIIQPSRIQAHLPNPKSVSLRNDVELVLDHTGTSNPVLPTTGAAFGIGIIPSCHELPSRNPSIDNDERYNSFRTWSGRQFSSLRGKQIKPEANTQQNPPEIIETLPADRYFDALDGPELDTLKPSEEILLPEDKQWPFLLRYPIPSFGICLGISSQAVMWKTLATTSSTHFLHIGLQVNLVLWCVSVAISTIVAFTYLLKVILYFEAVRREYYHPIRVNFFFAPFITCLLLALGVPPSVTKSLHASVWYVLMTPILILEVKIYGQWMFGGQRRLSKVANPTNHLSIVGNFVGALLGASMGLKEGPVFFFAVGLAHFTVLFVTLYQRLPTNATLPKELHPVFFLFIASPSVASLAWARIQGSYDYFSRITYFTGLFLYFALVVRVNFFRGLKFSLAWWAYTLPMTSAAIATIRYSNEVSNIVTRLLAVTLSSVSTLTVTGMLITTFIRTFVLKDMFPNDIAIAISDRKPNTRRKWYRLRYGRSDSTKGIENYLKYACRNRKDVEVSVTSSIT